MVFDHFETNLKKENDYPKLVRDKIPEIIENNENKKVKTRILEDDREYLDFLFKKIEEEANELANTKNEKHLMEELSDVMEIIDEILKVSKLDLEKIREVQRVKNLERGGFKKRILMLEKI